MLNGTNGIVAGFCRDRRGGTAMLFALASIPVLGIVGAALDYSRASSTRSLMQNAADSAALAAARETALPWEQRKRIAQDIFKSHFSDRKEVQRLQVVPRQQEGAIVVDASGNVRTVLAGLFGKDGIPTAVRAEVHAGASAKLELALVLDTTGSMRNDMEALRAAATSLTEKVMGGGAKVSVVPYSAAVNPGRANLSVAWLDNNAESRFHAIALENKRTFMRVGCDPGWGPPTGGGNNGGGNHGSGGGGRGSDRSSLDDVLHRLNGGLATLFGVVPAFAMAEPTTANGGPIPAGWTSDRCFLYTPRKISHFDLFARIPDQQWKGCVEARPAPFDVTDETPDPGRPDTLFVPYFWPDEPDKAINEAWGGGKYPNNYLTEVDPPLAGYKYDGNQPDGDSGRYTTILKYDGRTSSALPVAPKSTGPNASCPDEILPLTVNKADVQRTIAKLMHWEGGGTISSEGLMWGWRVLSPGAPFTEGAPYGSTEKVIVLMTDGVNEAAPQVSWGCCESDYTAYGTLNSAHNDRKLISQWKHSEFSKFMDQRLAEACRNVKNAGIKIYTVLFNVSDPKTEKLYQECATKPDMAYDARNQAQLAKAFDEIAANMQGAIRLAR